MFVSIPLMAQSGSIPISSGWDRSRCDDLPVKNQRQKPRAWWRCFKSPSPSNSESYQERLEKGLEITPRLLQGSRNRSYHVGNVLAVVSHPIAVYLQYPHLRCRLSGPKVSKNEEVVTSAVIAAIRSCERLPRWLQHGTEMWPFLVVNLPLLSIKPQVSVSQGQYDKHISSIFKCGHTNTQYHTIISVIQITSYNTLTCLTQPSRQISISVAGGPPTPNFMGCTTQRLENRRCSDGPNPFDGHGRHYLDLFFQEPQKDSLQIS